MSKAVVSNRIILDVNKELKEHLVRTLTYKIPRRFVAAGGPHPGPEVIRTFGRLSETIYSVPVGRFDLIPPDHEIIDKRIVIPVQFPEFKFKLRPSQQLVHDGITDNAIVNAPVSWGKTFTAISVAAKLGQKTLIVCHNTMLRDQWVKDIGETLGIEAGVIGGGKVNYNSDIVVANVQTLVKHVDSMATQFGTLVLDEMHHVSASTFSTIVDKSKARYKIGLSGTLERKDGKHVIFNDYFGFDTYRPEAENYMVPSVIMVDSRIHFPEHGCWADKVTELENRTPGYKALVAELADSAVKQGHKVLVVGSRVEFLESLPDVIQARALSLTGSVNSMEARQEILSSVARGKTDVICGTCSIFSEGISQNDLSCIILATPINNDPMLTQLIGRIVRLKEGKQQPLIIDIGLRGGQTKSQTASRYAHYLRKGYTIQKLQC